MCVRACVWGKATPVRKLTQQLPGLPGGAILELDQDALRLAGAPRHRAALPSPHTLSPHPCAITSGGAQLEAWLEERIGRGEPNEDRARGRVAGGGYRAG